MSFSFKRKESVAKGVRRLAGERVETALDCLKDCRQAEAIHCVRKEIKKARAILRLVRTQITGEEYRRLNESLREAANHLSAVRDAHVKSAALKDLTQHFKGQLAPRALRHLRESLQSDSRAEATQFAKRKTASAVERRLLRCAKLFDQVTVRGKGWTALCPGLKTTYSQGRRAYRTVIKDTSPENFHEWRKRVKQLWYHVRVLQPVWPEQMDAAGDELKLLGEQLGDDHDLFLLEQSAEKQCVQNGNAKELETLRGLIAQRQAGLRGAALKLGARFYAEKPSMFAARLGRYWKLWRDEKKNTVGEVLK